MEHGKKGLGMFLPEVMPELGLRGGALTRMRKDERQKGVRRRAFLAEDP